jgi:simple sugar transport system substrate-binding protein
VTEELRRIDSYYQGNKDVKGMFAVDAGSTQGVGQVIEKYELTGKVQGGGYDLLDQTVQLVNKGALAFTIDQQPYLQGFLPVQQLYMYKLSGTLTGTGDVNTGLKFLGKPDVQPYLKTKTRYQGSSEEQRYVQLRA